jgi:hypothetical protein
MIRSALSKVVWMARATTVVVGVAIMLGLIFGVATSAFGANGGNFILGSLNNTATAITKLTGTVGGGPALQVSNPSTATGSTALDLQVATGKAPMKVNRTTKVTNLNADKLDGKDSTAFVPASRVPMWAVVNGDGTIKRKSPEVVSAGTIFSPGGYVVTFNRDVSQCAFAATPYTLMGNKFATAGTDLVGVNSVRVETWVDSGGASNSAFNLIVTC